MRTKTHFKTPFVSLVSLVQSRHVTPFFSSTESQESKSYILCNFCHLNWGLTISGIQIWNQLRMQQCTLWPILRPNLYLWCLRSSSSLSLPSLYPSPYIPPPLPSPSLSSPLSLSPLSLHLSLKGLNFQLHPSSILLPCFRPCHNCNLNWYWTKVPLLYFSGNNRNLTSGKNLWG